MDFFRTYFYLHKFTSKLQLLITYNFCVFVIRNFKLFCPRMCNHVIET